ncbi:unnamed protein product [Phytophthora lilii]|uniref:Unnamed protein product n=1 Tax=Phytophthora lilii TaxID=2077276 RepID=A0A9W6TMM3_9STRA|nr:unnamed protein product [Phytophthora lilii]
MRWSKNISEERDAPEQVMLGSLDPRVCALLNFAVYMEMSPQLPGSEYVFGNPAAGHRVIRRFLQDVFSSDDFQAQRSGNLGTHSLRKGAATYSSRCGVQKDYINRRGRWRTRKAIVDTYIDNTQPYPDAVAAGSLTGPLGPCFYLLRKVVQCVSTEFLSDKVDHITKQVLGSEVAKTMALPLLWAALTPPGGFDYKLIPNRLKERIVQQYIEAGGDRLVNPVNRVGVYIVGDGA